MKSSLTLIVRVLLLLNILAGCAQDANQAKGTASEHHGVAGFWLGLWHGFIAPFVFVASLFKSNLSIYEVHNNGGWYNFFFQAEDGIRYLTVTGVQTCALPI